MRAGERCRLHDRFIVDGLHPRDVVAYRAGEQLDVLRQKADMLSELRRIPMVDRRAVKPDLADIRNRKSDHQAAQRALACAGRTDDCQSFARLDGARDLAKDELSCIRREVTNRIHDHLPLRGREPRPLERRRVIADRLLQAIIGEPCGVEIAPHGNRKLHRRKRASEKYGSRDHGAGRKLRVHH